VAVGLALEAHAVQAPTDWDLLSLRLVNRARTNPAYEDQLRSTSHGETPVAPLAYDPLVGQAAENHSDWMGLNQSNPAINNPDNPPHWPESFTHYETLNGQPGGAPATTTPGYTGVSVTDRLVAAGYPWSAAGENIIWRSNTPTVNAALIESNHDLWWNSEGHRDNFMFSAFSAFGHHIRTDSQQWATQDFGRPSSSPRYYVFGLVFDDINGNEQWDPHDTGHADREGLDNRQVVFRSAGESTIVATDDTINTGSFATAIDNGTYDVTVESFTFENVVVNGENVDLGDVIVGDAAIGSADTLDVMLWGTQPVHQHTRYTTTGQATLAGTVDLARLNGYTPNPTDTFTIVQYGSRDGTFDTIANAGIGPGQSFSLHYDDRRVLAIAGQWVAPELTGILDVPDDLAVTGDFNWAGLLYKQGLGDLTIDLTGDPVVGPGAMLAVSEGSVTLAGSFSDRLTLSSIDLSAGEAAKQLAAWGVDAPFDDMLLFSVAPAGVPEPTSLAPLTGMAAIALRRRAAAGAGTRDATAV
jgi:hypothetical protein